MGSRRPLPPPCRPDLVDFQKLTKSNATYNLQSAFNTAEQHLGLSKLLDPEGKRGGGGGSVRPSVRLSARFWTDPLLDPSVRPFLRPIDLFLR